MGIFLKMFVHNQRVYVKCLEKGKIVGEQLYDHVLWSKSSRLSSQGVNDQGFEMKYNCSPHSLALQVDKDDLELPTPPCPPAQLF